MKKEIVLDGAWNLYISEHELVNGKEYSTCEALEKSGIEKIIGNVPGNFELDMQSAGLLEEPFFGRNILKLQDLENRHLWYSRYFDFNGDETQNYTLYFEGVDTFSVVFLNGVEIGKTDNMMIPFEFEVILMRFQQLKGQEWQ